MFIKSLTILIRDLIFVGRLLMELLNEANRLDFLWAVFAFEDPKTEKRHWWFNCLFALLRYASIKAAR